MDGTLEHWESYPTKLQKFWQPFWQPFSPARKSRATSQEPRKTSACPSSYQTVPPSAALSEYTAPSRGSGRAYAALSLSDGAPSKTQTASSLTPPGHRRATRCGELPLEPLPLKNTNNTPLSWDGISRPASNTCPTPGYGTARGKNDTHYLSYDSARARTLGQDTVPSATSLPTAHAQREVSWPGQALPPRS